MKTRMFASTLLCSLITVACGGGGGGSDTSKTSQTAQLADTSTVADAQGKVLLKESFSYVDSPLEPLGGNEVGIGIANLSYYDQTFAMADVARQAQFRPLDWSYNLALDSNGAPTTDCYLIISANALAAGTYKLQFQGRATVTITASSGARVANKTYDEPTNTTTADIILDQTSIGNTFLKFRDTRRTLTSATNDGVTNIRLWRPGYPTDGSAVFTREFIDAMRKFHVIRTMDFVEANQNPTANWTDRRKPSYIGQGTEIGQAWETMVQLANATGRDLWINVPVRATDEYIRKLAQLIKYGSDGSEPYTTPQAKPAYPPLREGIKVYLEYGNEIWNSSPGFLGHSRAKALSDIARVDPTHPIANDGPVSDPYIGLRRWIAYRSGVISQNFRSVFGDTAMMTTVRPILAAQVGNSNLYLSIGLTWAESYFGDVAKIWYGGGGAAYYDSTTMPVDTSPATMTAYFAGLPSPEFARTTALDAVWTKGFGLKTIAYEGGPTPGGSALGTAIPGGSQLAYAYNADPRMKDRMQAAHAVWQANGGDLLVYYTYTGGAPWTFHNGLINGTVSPTSTVKLQAIDAIRNQTKPAPVLGTPVPGTVTLRDPAASVQINLQNGGSWNYSGAAYRFVATNVATQPDFALIPIRTSKAGTYKLAISTYEGSALDTFEIYVNGTLQGTIKPTIHPAGTLQDSPQVTVELQEGLSVVRLKAKQGGPVWVKEMKIS